MKLIAAYLLAILGGNANPSAEDIRKILSSVGIETDDEKLELLLSQVKGRDINELLAAGREKLASVPARGGAAAVAAASAPVAGSGTGETAVVESKKDEKVEQMEECEDDLLFSLFE